MEKKRFKPAFWLLLAGLVCSLLGVFPELPVRLSRETFFLAWCIFLTGHCIAKVLEERLP